MNCLYNPRIDQVGAPVILQQQPALTSQRHTMLLQAM
jgi:hypothetical protein